jgi:FAD/FMN-containing dehydrogenase
MSETSSREANVLLEFQMVDPMSAEVLDANAEDVIEAVIEHAADTALGPAIAANPHECAIKLRFDVLAEDDAAILQQVSKVIQVILEKTDLRLSRSSIEAQEDAGAHDGEFAPA